MDELSIIGLGILMIVFGIFIIWFVSKRPKNTGISSVVNFKGYTFGVVSIILGIIFILKKLHLV